MKTRVLITITVVVLLFVFVPFEAFFMQDTTALTNQENRYHILVKDEKISAIHPDPEYYNAQTELIPVVVTQHIQSDLPISSVNFRNIHFLNDIEYQSDAGGIANLSNTWQL